MIQKIAYFDASHDLPEELITAAGFIPYKILGDVHTSNEPADQYLNNFSCPAARSFLTEALAHSKEWAGIAFSHGCDATNRHFDVWKMHVETPFIYWFNAPMNLDALAAKFEKKEMERFITALEKKFKVDIPSEKINIAIKESNEIKNLMQQLGGLRGIKDIPNVDYFEICVKAVQLPKTEVIPLLKKILADWEKRPAFPANKKKILLTGSDVTYKEWMMILDEANLRVVRDDLSVGERYYMTLIPQKGDPLDGLVEYYFNVPRASTRNPPDPRYEYLLNAMQKSGLNGMVSQNLKFCEPYAFDSVFTVNQIKAKGFQAIHLEREFAASIDQQLLNRLEAFKEML